ncbi:SCO family protein [Frankia sp. Cas3]|uniref:SCO family protein n=2 Tax=unclassified Frankia TaxID=2632575 RepID=UPI002AD2475B|nr:SCO family protein [Frankia sp. Cas3]
MSLRFNARVGRPRPARRWIVAVALCCLAGCASSPAGEAPHPALSGSSSIRPSAVRPSLNAGPAAGGWHGTVAKVSRPRPSFTLVDTSGRNFDFAKETAGRATLLFFGYTNCADVCPTTMADIAAAKQLVSSAVGSAVTVVFVTTDPGRDTAGVLRRWLNQFDSTFVGLTGSPAQLDAAQQAAGVPLASAQQVPGGRYSVAHAAQVAGYGADNTEHVLYFASTKVADYAADFPRLVAVS